MEHALTADHISKKYKIYSNPWHKAMEWVWFGRKQIHKEFWALKDISFNVERGECLGIIGPNGAGKSTLLKILTGALYPTSGRFHIHGRVLSLLELGTGFNPELTGRRNLSNSASLLGFPEDYIERRMEDIREFADLGDFFDRSIKLYSSGMYVRLAFSMFVFMEPDVLIIDEALSVGDIFFQQKCFEKMRDMISRGTTCLFVSHDTAAVQNLCRRAILLRGGQIAFSGDVRETVSRYFGTLGSRNKGNSLTTPRRDRIPRPLQDLMDPKEILTHSILREDTGRHGTKELEILAARVTDQSGRDTLQIDMQARLTFHLLIRANGDVVDPSAGIHLYDRLGNLVFATGFRQQKESLPDLSKGDELIARIELQLNIQPGEYTFSLGVSEPSSDENENIAWLNDRHELLGPIVVVAREEKILPFYGIAQLPIAMDYGYFPGEQLGQKKTKN
jgi:lipopolysaccharide transport system ATP-binding protein